MGAAQAVERAARASYGRLLAYLATRTQDVAAAEDALADAFRAALERWNEHGVPDNPEAWLLTAARRRLIDRFRRQKTEADAQPGLALLADEAQERTGESALFPDERLKLLFVCAHPALDVAARTPLMLQTVLGLDAKAIAAAFVVKPATMGQRLARAKAKIRDAGIAFQLPEAKDLPERLDAVLEAIYAAYGRGWESRTELAGEAIGLGRLLVALLPEEPEARGLLALMLHCEARRTARRDENGAFVPLSSQDPSLWSQEAIAEAEALLLEASTKARLGRFQLEAAIQSVHARRSRSGTTDWQAIAYLYEGLIRFAPTIGAAVGRAAAVAEAFGAEAGWRLLAELAPEEVVSYQPYWALSAHLLGKLGRAEQASEALERAIGLSSDPALRAFLAKDRR